MARKRSSDEATTEIRRIEGSIAQASAAEEQGREHSRPMWIGSTLADSEAMLSAYLEYVVKCYKNRMPRPPELMIYNHKGGERPQPIIGNWRMEVMHCSQANCERCMERRGGFIFRPKNGRRGIC